jgi:hypothetical protein
VEARGAVVVRAVACREGRLGRDQQLVALALDRGTKDLLGGTRRIDVGAVEQGDAMVEADVDQPARFGNVGRAPGLEEVIRAAEGRGAEGEGGHTKARGAEMAIFHGLDLSGQ